jgi:uncharacterized protein (TIGR02996 family)
MTTEDALLAAVWASPHDDLPRLVYADWLDETGDPAKAARAEFIRVQCELAHPSVPSDRRAKLEGRERNLWLQYRREFKRGLPPQLSDKPFRRGFASEHLFEVSGHQLLNTFVPILHTAPLWAFSLHEIERNALEAFLASDEFVRVGELRLHYASASVREAFPALFRRDRRLNLTALDWRSSGVSAGGIELLAAADLPHLRSLRLPGAAIADRGGEALAGSPLAGQLVELSLSGNKLGPAGVRAMIGRFPVLADLDLSHFEGGDTFVEVLANGPAWPALKRLKLGGDGLTARGAELLAGWAGGATLDHLDLTWQTGIGTGGVLALTRSPHLAGLKSLRLTPSDRDRAFVTDVMRDRFQTAEWRHEYGFGWTVVGSNPD